MDLISLSEVAARRDGAGIFAPVSHKVVAGQVTELVGSNGAGKTTLLRCVAGLYEQFSGTIDVAPFVFSGHRLGLDPRLNAIENLTWVMSLRSEEASSRQLTQQRMVAALDRTGVAHIALKPLNQMSQGQQRRVVMARWLLSCADVWLLDEPLNALDVAGQALLRILLAEHCEKGGGALVATHTPLELSHVNVQTLALEGVR